jgi:CheY-like chemotaxis protein
LPKDYKAAEGSILRTEQEPETIPPLPPDANFENRKILVVDDDSRNIFAIRSILESRGMEVVAAENGRVALETLVANPDCSLVLMDTMMPEMNGLEAIEAIRKIDRFSQIPIISLTAKAMKGDREKCISAGASDYITKPVDPIKLLAVIYSWIQRTTRKVA